MSILINNETRLLVHGITGHQGLFHARAMRQFGTNIVAGLTPGKGGRLVLDGSVPVFDTAKAAVTATGANCSVIFVPPRSAADSILEAADAGVPLIVCITEGVPVRDMMLVRQYLDQLPTRLLGPNCPGLLTPGQSNVGIIPGSIAVPGNIGLVSRSGTLTYEIAHALKARGLGLSTCVGIGGDPVNGTSFIDVLQMFEDDPDTAAIVMIGEIGGTDEEHAAEYVSSRISKPVVGFIAGQTAPPGKRMGHAGAIVEGSSGLAADKIKALEAAGVVVAPHPDAVADLVARRCGIETD